MPCSPWWRSWIGIPGWIACGGSPASSHGPPLIRGPWRGDADFCVEVLNEAIYRFGPPDIMNSDQGSQFTSFAWTDRLRRSAIRISMDGKGRYLDNIFIELVAHPEIRVRLSACLGDRVTGLRECPDMDRVLQSLPAAQGPLAADRRQWSTH